MHRKTTKGYVIISATLIILFVTIGIVSAMAYLSNGNLKMYEAELSGEQVLLFSDSCLEETILRIKADPLYSGGTVAFPNGSCQIDVESQDGAFQVQAYFLTDGSDHIRGIEAEVEIIDGKAVVKNWEENPDVIE